MLKSAVPLVSVCVPTFNRATMLRDVITSFWAQDLVEAELVIVDDASLDETQTLCESVAQRDRRIVYQRSAINVGFCENLRRAFAAARGRVLVVLGDDDILIGKDSLKKYVDVFEGSSDVHYVYANQIQMDATMNFDGTYRYFKQDSYFDSGRMSFENTWLTSILITGMAFRRSAELFDSFPTSTVLFPQVELVGRLLQRYASYGIADFLTAPRAHADQLGFHANRRERIVGPERHGTLEILDIVDRLNTGDNRGPNMDRTARALARSLATNLPNEKIRGTTGIAMGNVLRLMQRSAAARRSPSLVLSTILTIPTPPGILELLRVLAKGVIRRRHQREANWFEDELQRQTDWAADGWPGILGISSHRGGFRTRSARL